MNPTIKYIAILIAAAVIPAIFLMIKVYKSDRLEKESRKTLFKLALGGMGATVIAFISEPLFPTFTKISNGSLPSRFSVT